MARKISTQPSRALAEFRLLPQLTTPESVPSRISLRTPLATCFKTGRTVYLNIPIVSAAMQAVSTLLYYGFLLLGAGSRRR